MKEQLIDLYTAKLAKDRGFLEPCFHYFSMEGDEKQFMEDGLYFPSMGENGRLILRPTQSQLQKWLREKYEIYIEILLDQTTYPKFACEITHFLNYEFIHIEQPDWSLYRTYEEALEIALFKALKYTI